MIHFHVQEMNSMLSTSFLCVQCLVFLVLLNTCPSLAPIGTDPVLYAGCSSRFSCGGITVGYPFWGGDRPSSCGHPDLLLKCDRDDFYATTITIRGINYGVQKIDESAQTLTIVRQELHMSPGGICRLALVSLYNQQEYVNTTINDDVFAYSAGYEDLTIGSGCSFSVTHPGRFACDYYSTDVFLQTGANVISGACNNSITVPVSTNLTQAAKGKSSLLADAVYNGFELKWKLSIEQCEHCRNSGGSCGFGYGGLVCYCPNLPDLPYFLPGSVCANSSHVLLSPPPAHTVQSPPPPEKESILSMFGARGTAGYIAPEVFCRTIGEVSHKSDVYSYGMMVLEMIGGRKNIDVIVSHTSEIYFPNWIYKRLEPGKDFEFHGVVTEEEKEMAKKMIIVSMWCIQTIPLDRPSIDKVLEMLEGSLESLQVPPKPSLSVPTRSPKHSIPLSSLSASTSSYKPGLVKQCGDK